MDILYVVSSFAQSLHVVMVSGVARCGWRYDGQATLTRLPNGQLLNFCRRGCFPAGKCPFCSEAIASDRIRETHIRRRHMPTVREAARG